MKTFRWLVTVILVAGVAHAADRRDGGLHGELRKMCDPVCELHAQDGAFSLLIETYRQFQSYQIETDYQMRLQAARGLSEDRGSLVIESSSKGMQTLRQYIFSLAKQERDLRFEKLQTQCANFSSAYTCVRKTDENYIGEKVPNTASQCDAAQKLRDYCVINPGTLGKGEIRKAGCIPVSTVLLDAPTVAPDPDRLIESCE